MPTAAVSQFCCQMAFFGFDWAIGKGLFQRRLYSLIVLLKFQQAVYRYVSSGKPWQLDEFGTMRTFETLGIFGTLLAL